MIRTHLPPRWMHWTWLEGLPWSTRALWPMVIEHVTIMGESGCCPAVSITRFAGIYAVPEEAIAELLACAEAAGQIDVGYNWTITEWHLYEEPEPLVLADREDAGRRVDEYRAPERQLSKGALRQRKWREKLQASRNVSETSQASPSVSDASLNVSRNVSSVSETSRNVSVTSPPSPLDSPPSLSPQTPQSDPPLNPPSPFIAPQKKSKLPRFSNAEIEEYWQRFSKAFPKRGAARLDALARRKHFVPLLEGGMDPELLILKATEYCHHSKNCKKPYFGTDTVCQMTTWLSQSRWLEDLSITDADDSSGTDAKFRAAPKSGADYQFRDLGHEVDGRPALSECFAGTRVPFIREVWQELRGKLGRAPSVDECLAEIDLPKEVASGK